MGAQRARQPAGPEQRTRCGGQDNDSGARGDAHGMNWHVLAAEGTLGESPSTDCTARHQRQRLQLFRNRESSDQIESAEYDDQPSPKLKRIRNESYDYET